MIDRTNLTLQNWKKKPPTTGIVETRAGKIQDVCWFCYPSIWTISSVTLRRRIYIKISQGSRQPLPGIDIRGADWFGKYVNFVIPPVSIISSTTFRRRLHGTGRRFNGPNTGIRAINIHVDIIGSADVDWTHRGCVCVGYSWTKSYVVQLEPWLYRNNP